MNMKLSRVLTFASLLLLLTLSACHDSGSTKGVSPSTVTEAWPLPPLVAGTWEYADKQTSRNLLDQLQQGAPSDEIVTARQITKFRTMPLSFYPGAKLCEGLVPSSSAGTGIFTFVVLQDSGVVLLNGTSPPIHDLDAKAPLAIDTAKRAEAYLRFFAAAVYAKNGNFRIVDESGDLLWARDASEADKQLATKYIRPLLLNRGEDGRWHASATVQSGSRIGNAVFDIDSNGRIDMSNSWDLASNLPLRRDAFNGPLRYELTLYK
jgi:hypothetical protein